jgi:hypothetical protein
MNLAVATDSQAHFFGQCIYNRYAHSMQASGYLVAVIIKLTAGMKHGHNNFCRRNAFIMHFCGNTTAIIRDSNCLIGVNNNTYLRAVSGQSLIY